MRIATILLITLATTLAVSSEAAIIRVDNNSGNPSKYTTAQTAHDSAISGDTLHFIGSGISYGNLTATKKLYIFGPGYVLTQNPETQANPNNAQLGEVTFNSGSDSSLLTGIYCKTIYIYTSNIFIKRNWIYNQQNNGATPYYSVYIHTNLGNIYIEENFIERYTFYGNMPALYISSGGSNILVENNIMRQTYSSNYEIFNSASSITASHNVIIGGMSLSNSTFDHNIHVAGNSSNSSNSSSYNISHSTTVPSGNNNIQNQSMSSVFVTSGSRDGQFQLAASSPAKGAGLGGKDIGAFGGNTPYVLSGLPAIPAIYFFSAPSTGSGATGLPVTIKIKSHN